MKAPKLLGFPIYMGWKSKVGKKHMNEWWVDRLFKNRRADFYQWQSSIANFGVGSIINECSGLNSRITQLTPYYRGFGSGQLLIDIDISTETNGCSLRHCGVCAPLSLEELKQRRLDILSSSSARTWGWDLRYREDVLTFNPDGTHKVDYDLLKRLEEARARGEI